MLSQQLVSGGQVPHIFRVQPPFWFSMEMKKAGSEWDAFALPAIGGGFGTGQKYSL
jgi:hypothetical protein